MHPAIITASELKRLLPERPVVLDCRFSLQDSQLGQRLYSEGHIPAAYHCDLNRDLSARPQPLGGRHPLPPVSRFIQTAVQWGITPITQVIVYDDNRLGFAARAWWMLRAIGIEQVRILDGGYSSWKQAGYALDRRTPAPRAGRLPTINHWPGIVEAEQVQAARQSGSSASHPAVLIDSREPARYRGEQEPIDPVAGHIPGARNKPWLDVTTEEGFIRPLDEQQQRWADIDFGQNALITYCGSGVTACVNLFSLYLCGRTDAQLYAGSWSDWCARPGYPIEVGEV